MYNSVWLSFHLNFISVSTNISKHNHRDHVPNVQDVWQLGKQPNSQVLVELL